MKFIIFLLIIFIFQIECKILSKEEINSLKERSYIVVRDSTGKVLGSGADITPRPLYIYFDYFKYFPKTKEIEVKGGGCSVLTTTDTIYEKNLKIIKAKNNNDTLFDTEFLYPGKMTKSPSGKFQFKTNIDSLKCLYFLGGYTRVFEYKISKLLKMRN